MKIMDWEIKGSGRGMSVSVTFKEESGSTLRFSRNVFKDCPIEALDAAKSFIDEAKGKAGKIYGPREA